MDQEFQTTFIPKKPLAEERKKTAPVKKPLGIFNMLATLIFVITLLIVGGVFVYERFMAGQIEASAESLRRAEAAFETSLVEELQTLDTRLKAAETLLSQHIAISPVFRILENDTLKSVQYEDFTYVIEGDRGLIEMTGLARSYQAIAEQSVLFGENRFVEDHIFSDFSLTDEGLVSFGVVLTLGPDLLYFEESLGQVTNEFGNTTSVVEEAAPGTETLPVVEESLPAPNPASAQ